MSRPVRTITALLIALLCVSCSSAPQRKPFDFGPFAASNPRSIVVAPVAVGWGAVQYRNKEEREAVDGVLATIAKPLAERGYYVLPVRMTQALAAKAGVAPYTRKDFKRAPADDEADAAAYRERAVKLANYFGADSVLFVQVIQWRQNANLSEGFLANLIDEKMDYDVGLDYLLVDSQGRTIWRAKKQVVYTRGGGDWVTELWNVGSKPSDAAIKTALAAEVSWWTITGKVLRRPKLAYFASDPLPVGPYHPRYDRTRVSGAASPDGQ